MKVRLRTLMAGPAGVVQPGQVADVDEATASEPPKIEIAEIRPPEAAVTRPRRGRR